MIEQDETENGKYQRKTIRKPKRGKDRKRTNTDYPIEIDTVN